MSEAGSSPVLWPISQLTRAYGARELSPLDVAREALDRIAAYDPELGAYLTVTEAGALAQAAAAEQAYAHGEWGPLLGVPLSIKDLFDVAGVRSTFGSLAHAGDVAAEDSPAVARLRAAGAVFLGKTNTAEFGQSATTETLVGPPARNPWDPSRTAGGSSGGAAGSVGAGLATAALGSDGGGSIRIPAAFCGLFGLKPTHGAVPGGGRFRAMSEFTCAGPVTRRVADARPLLGVLAGIEVPRRAGMPRLRIAWCPALEGHPVDPALARVTEHAFGILRGLGPHEVVEAPPPVEGWRDVFRVLVLAEEWRERGSLLREPGLELTEYERRSLAAGEKVTAAEVEAALATLRRMRAAYEPYFEAVDLAVTPATAVPAFPIGERPREIAGRRVDWVWGPFPFTPQFNVAGVPAASLPIGFAAGLPVGLQLVARPGAETLLLDVCEALEEAIGFDTLAPARRRPDPRRPAAAGRAGPRGADLRAEWADDRILVLTIDRPQRRNVLDHELLAGLAERLREEQDRASAVILRGAGARAFSAGFDLGRLEGSEADLDADASIGRAVEALAGCPAPVVAQVGGHCHGGGVELALSCDLRIASSDLQLSLGAVSLGVVYRYEFLVRLVAMCGLGRARDLLLGQRRLDAREALAWGLVTEVVGPAELEERALQVARAAAALPRVAVAGTRASLLQAAAGAFHGEADRLALEWRRRAARSDEHRAALAAARARLSARAPKEEA